MQEMKNILFFYNPLEILVFSEIIYKENFLKTLNLLPSKPLINFINLKINEKVDIPDFLKQNNSENKAVIILCKYLNENLISQQTIKNGFLEINFKEKTQNQNKLVLDKQTLFNLNIYDGQFFNQQKNNQINTLFDILNNTVTAFGERMLQKWTCFPLIDKQEIEQRQNCIQDLQNNNELILSFQKEMAKLLDLQNILVSLFSYRFQNKSRGVYFDNISQIRLKQLKNFFENIKFILFQLKEAFQDCQYIFQTPYLINLVSPANFQQISIEIKNIENKIQWLKESKIPTPSPKTCPQYDKKVEELKNLENQLNIYLEDIKKLYDNDQRIIYSHQKGPFQLEFPIQIIKKYGKLSHFELVSITKTTQRFYTKELIFLIEKVEYLEDEIKQILANFVSEIFEEVFQKRHFFKNLISTLSELDCLISLNIFSQKKTKPIIIQEQNTQNFVQIIKGKYPLIQQNNKNKEYVPNNIFLSFQKQNINCSNQLSYQAYIITGPNMGGKSTTLRMVALNVILAQIGCFLPCEYMILTPFENIFSRIGMSELLEYGKSTFYIELEETLQIINKANNKSLVLIDELGRGTSTYDGVCFAISVLKYLLEKNMGLIMFCTNQNLLLDLFRGFQNVGLFRMDFKFANNNYQNIQFLYKLVEGECMNVQAFNLLEYVGFDHQIIFESQYRSSLMFLNNLFQIGNQ
ncbi:hypothetical protein IMG5_200020 [Ichthyophthirius multifiliis]|uniref:DNA mismatch repair proteins mutS family domain-containing protein n=1 Tax=Ichthyophthirius multifiliis TaxID=5932 RepID=G0R5P3_ICHMU|nr:hypothetical protein IMG5_200020 [Ichthyophthirius multifiliis]EGR27216.1 hypothetical protein IMG5_200020 [Ichthyophthirius multifiliis]|eukprot:XP_004024100.1 hypothetical protein IMG5_200020 [Ichthyophthirius multifiliis]